MKSIRSLLIGLAALWLFALLSNVSFAECGTAKTDFDAKIKVMRDSAMALQITNPDLAKSLNDMADKKAKAMQEWKMRKDSDMKTINDAAMALEKTNPDLAKSLKDMGKSKMKSEMPMVKDDITEIKGAGEKMEPSPHK